MKLTVVYDNRAAEAYLDGWGFACVVETGENRFLFDTGADWPTLDANLKAAGIDPQSIDSVFISHMHADHTGGLAGLAALVRPLTVYLPASGSESLADELEADRHVVRRLAFPEEIAPGVFSTGELFGPPPEQSMVLALDVGFVLVTGCAHPGIANLVREAGEAVTGPPLLMLGGFHLKDRTAQDVEAIAAGLIEAGAATVAPCHCTGENAMKILENALGDHYRECMAGSAFQVP